MGPELLRGGTPQPTPKPTTPPPVRPTPARSANWFTRAVGRGLCSIATSHTTDTNSRSYQVIQTNFGPLIAEISKQATKQILDACESSLLDSGEGAIQEAVEHLTSHVFQALATRGQEISEHPENLNAEELGEHFLATLIEIFKTEFNKAPPAGISDQKEIAKLRFKNIANEILKIAFPKNIDDPHLPYGVRTILANRGILANAVNLIKDTKGLTWDNLVDIFAEQLASIYDKVVNKSVRLDEATSPGANALISRVVARFDAKLKDTKELGIEIPGLDPASNGFVNRFLVRVLQIDATQQNLSPDEVLILDAKVWLMDHLKVSLQVIYSTLLDPDPEKRNRSLERLFGKANSALPDLQRELRSIHAYSEKELRIHLESLQKSPKDSYFHADIQKALKELKADVPASIEAAKILAKEIVAFNSIDQLLKDNLSAVHLQQLLPPLLSARKVLNWLYSYFLSPLLVELVEQVDSVDRQAEENALALKARGGAEVAGWIDQMVKITLEMLEKQAGAETFKPSEYPFLNQLVCHILRPETLAKFPQSKLYVESFVRKLVTVIVYNAIKREGNGSKRPEEALASLLNKAVKGIQRAISDLPGSTPDEKKRILKERAVNVLEQLLPKEGKDGFDALLPKFLRKGGLYESLSEQLAEYMYGMYEQTKKVVDIGKDIDCSLQEPQLVQLSKKLYTDILEMLQEPSTQESAYDRLKRTLLGGDTVRPLIEKALGPVLDAILAFHLNPKDNTQTSETKAATLFISLLNEAEGGFELVERCERAPSENWLVENGYTQEAIDRYKERFDMPKRAPVDAKEFLLRETADKIVAKLLPLALKEKLISKEFAWMNVDQQLAKVVYSYLRDGYDYSHAFKGVSLSPSIVELQQFIVREIRDHFGKDQAQGASWLEKVVKEIFTPKDEAQGRMLEKVTSNLFFGVFGILFGKLEGLPDVTQLVAPILDDAEKMFQELNKPVTNREKLDSNALNISDDDILSYFDAIGKPLKAGVPIDYEALEINQLCYWVAARRLLDVRFPKEEDWKKFFPKFLQPIITKDMAANFARGLYKALHDVQRVLEAESAKGRVLVERKEKLEPFAKDKFINTLTEFLHDEGVSDEPLSKKLPTIINTFLKQCFADEVTPIARVRNTLVVQTIYTVLGKLLQEMSVGEGAHLVLQDKGALLDKVATLVSTYNQGDDRATVSYLLQTAVPESLSSQPLAKLLLEQLALPEFSIFCSQIRASQAKLQLAGARAKANLEGMKGVKHFLDESIHNLDSTLKKMVDGGEQLADSLPPILDEQFKSVLRHPQLGPVAREAIHLFVYIALDRLFTPPPGKTRETHVAEVMAQLVGLYSRERSIETGREWLKVLVPQDLLDEFLPPFLKKSFTHENLSKWFFEPYVKQVQKVEEKAKAELEIEASSNVTTMQNYMTNWLKGLSKPDSSDYGIMHYPGVVRDIEKRLLATVGTLDPALGKTVTEYVQANIAQLVRRLEGAKLPNSRSTVLSDEFLSQRLLEALPQLSNNPLPIHGMPAAADCGQRAAECVMQLLFPNGAADLLIPEVARNAIFNQFQGVLKGLFDDLTNSKARTLWILARMVSSSTSDQRLVQQRSKLVEEMRHQLHENEKARQERRALPYPNFDAEFTTKTEPLFKRIATETAVRQADEAVGRTRLWGPLKWFARQAVKIGTNLLMRFTVRDKLYRFVSDSRSDDKMRRMIWVFLNPQPGFASRKELKTAFQEQLEEAELLPSALTGPAASGLAGSFTGKNFIHLFFGSEIEE